MGFGLLVGLCAGLWLSVTFIFPADVLSIKLTALTIGDLLRILGGALATIAATVIGTFIGGIWGGD